MPFAGYLSDSDRVFVNKDGKLEYITDGPNVFEVINAIPYDGEGRKIIIEANLLKEGEEPDLIKKLLKDKWISSREYLASI